MIMNTRLCAHLFRGSRKSYYDGAFIAKNEDVDDHLALIGYFDETLMVRKKVLIVIFIIHRILTLLVILTMDTKILCLTN